SAGSWKWGRTGQVNGTLLWPDAFAYLGEQLSRSLRPSVPLSEIAHGRSGDKGDHANVAVLAYTAEGYAWLRRHLTPDAVARYFAPLVPTKVERFEAANLLGLNFVLYDV